ncbi:MAG: rod shape-determining protein MreC [Flavobacteriales bacterium]|nr:rod shape-determining protein MreC [Bacteroidota bacterium]MCB9241488.1 rod shape-determining protein MreC [Flavobacteriales bacterium]
MQNLLQFLRNNFHIFLFLVLQIVSLTALFRYNTYHQSIYFNTASSVNGSVLGWRNDVTSYFNLRAQNEALRKENITLRTAGTENFLFFSSDTFLFKNREGMVQFSYIPAKVINNNTAKPKNYFTINRGTDHGIKPGMGVIAPTGVVGVTTECSRHFSVAMSILNRDFKLTPKINKQVHYGNVNWNGNDPRYVQINRINDYYDILDGQEVATTSYAHYFPTDIPIGRVHKVEKAGDGKYLNIDVELSTDMSQLSTVYVIKNMYKSELDSLEQSVSHENR